MGRSTSVPQAPRRVIHSTSIGDSTQWQYWVIDVVSPLDPSSGVASYESYEPARYAMGDTLDVAQRMNLI